MVTSIICTQQTSKERKQQDNVSVKERIRKHRTIFLSSDYSGILIFCRINHDAFVF